MSSSESIQQHKRKHGEVADQVIHGLEGYSELTPKSQKLRDDLLRTARRIRDLEDADDQLLGSAFAFFEAKQKQTKEIKEEREDAAERAEKLKRQLESTQSELENARSEEEVAKKTLDKHDFMFQNSDWLGKFLSYLEKVEKQIQDEEAKALTDVYEEENRVNKAAAEAKAKREAKEKGEPYRGPGPYEKICPQGRAKEEARWGALIGRQVTDTHKRVLAERKALDEWREVSDEDTPAPPTRFLDRIDKICKRAGLTRSMCLEWIKEYSDRNETCHNPPPLVKDYQKTIEKDGKVVKVKPDKETPEEAIDWVGMKATIEEAKVGIEKRFEEGRLEKEKRDCYVELMGAYWKALSTESDEAGNPILTDYAKRLADDVRKGTGGTKGPVSPPQRISQRVQEEQAGRHLKGERLVQDEQIGQLSLRELVESEVEWQADEQIGQLSLRELVEPEPILPAGSVELLHSKRPQPSSFLCESFLSRGQSYLRGLIEPRSSGV